MRKSDDCGFRGYRRLQLQDHLNITCYTSSSRTPHLVCKTLEVTEKW